MAQLTLPQQTLDTDNLINVVRVIMSCIRLQDDGGGNLDIVTNVEALPLAESFWDRYAGELGLIPVDPDNITGQEYAQCVFKKIRNVFKEAHLLKAGEAPKDTYIAAVEAANSNAITEVNDVLGT